MCVVSSIPISEWYRLKSVGFKIIWCLRGCFIFEIWLTCPPSWGDVWLFRAPCCYNLNTFGGMNFKLRRVCCFDKLNTETGFSERNFKQGHTVFFNSVSKSRYFAFGDWPSARTAWPPTHLCITWNKSLIVEQFHFVLLRLLHEAAQIVKINSLTEGRGSTFTVKFTAEGMEKQSTRSESGMKMNEAVWR